MEYQPGAGRVETTPIKRRVHDGNDTETSAWGERLQRCQEGGARETQAVQHHYRG